MDGSILITIWDLFALSYNIRAIVNFFETRLTFRTIKRFFINAIV